MGLRRGVRAGVYSRAAGERPAADGKRGNGEDAPGAGCYMSWPKTRAWRRKICGCAGAAGQIAIELRRECAGDPGRDIEAAADRQIWQLRLTSWALLGRATGYSSHRAADWLGHNRSVPVIVTTNLGPGASAVGVAAEYARVARPETLGDRIGARMWSRLQQMCRAVDMTWPGLESEEMSWNSTKCPIFRIVCFICA